MEIINVKDYKIGYTDQFFFDTNIWLLLFAPIADCDRRNQKEYSNLLAEIIQKKKPIFITSMIFSEFANVLLRKDFRNWKEKEKKHTADFKKDFVPSKDYEQSVYSITLIIQKILKLPNIQPVSDSFHNINKENILNNFNLADFNDAYTHELAVQNNYKIISNDNDFKKFNSKITLITTQSSAN